MIWNSLAEAMIMTGLPAIQTSRPYAECAFPKSLSLSYAVNACHPGDVNSTLSNNLVLAVTKRRIRALRLRLAGDSSHWSAKDRSIL